ncbi:MAG: hypothetical protein IMZ46_05735, partial [Acidobacteria bacterium]|nr:hypothetical protein [Acidobacteriota bacterium]
PKPRTKRKEVREDRKRKHEDNAPGAAADDQAQEQGQEQEQEHDDEKTAKRPRLGDQANEFFFDTGRKSGDAGESGTAGEAQFFGMLTDEEQEYFRGTAEVLELNDFAAPEDRAIFVENVFKEAAGKEMKLACSQGCSRLMEKLILLSSPQQKKRLFEAFAGNFLALVQHRFASHCCEMLFLQAAPVVGAELSGVAPAEEQGAGEEDKSQSSMEDLFLLTLDELESDLSFLLTQTYASHTLRALLLILSGKPLEDATASTLLKSKKKEGISVPGVATGQEESNQQLRAVPETFTMAVHKIISDTIMALDSSGLRILVTHPTGNPILQLLLELDISYNAKAKKSKDESAAQETLLSRLLPGAPDSLKDTTGQAYEFVTAMLYDPIGSRLLETLIVHAPGKVFKAMHQNIFAKRIATYVRNEIACYPCIKIFVRLSKDDLVACVDEIIPVMPTLMEKSRHNVIKTLLDRCAARGATHEVEKIAQALVQACGGRAEDIVPKLCLLREEETKGKADLQSVTRNKQALVSHGAQLISMMLSIPASADLAQTSLRSLSPEELAKLATGATPTMFMLKTALSTPASNPVFHKVIVASLIPHIPDLAVSQSGHNIVNEVFVLPSKGKGHSVPFHLKQAVMAKLAESEELLRESWMGRSVWRTWKGDVWKRGDPNWGAFAKGAEGREAGYAGAPTSREKQRREAEVRNPHIVRRFAKQAERKSMKDRDDMFDARRRARGDAEMRDAPAAAADGEDVVEEKKDRQGGEEELNGGETESKEERKERKKQKKAAEAEVKGGEVESKEERKQRKKEKKMDKADGGEDVEDKEAKKQRKREKKEK